MTRAEASNCIGLGALALLCLLLGSRWLLEGMQPKLASRTSTEALGAAMAALLWSGGEALFAMKAGEGGTSWRQAAVGALALCGPTLASLIPRRPPNANNATLALALCPVVVAVMLAGAGQLRADLPARLWPGLAGTSGLLLLLPEPRWTDGRFVAALVAMPLLVGIGAALYAGLAGTARQNRPDSRPRLNSSVVALLFAATVYGVQALGSGSNLWAPSTLFATLGAAGLDGACLLLSLLSLSCLGAERWTAQFLLAPLVALVEGVVLLHPILDLKSWAAFVLLSVSGGYLLLVRSERPPELLSLSG